MHQRNRAESIEVVHEKQKERTCSGRRGASLIGTRVQLHISYGFACIKS